MVKRRQPGRIEQLLAADEANIRVSPQLMAALDSWMVKAFEDTATLYRLLYRRLGDWEVENTQDTRLRDIARAHGITDKQLIERLNSGQAQDIDGAEAAYARLWTLRVVKIIVLTCQRYWAWGAAELFRLRITSAQGYLRLEAESLALVALFLQDDALADRWSHIFARQEGQRFFRDTQSQVKEILRRFDLNNTYDLASGSSQHARMAGMVRSLISSGGELRLPDQDFNKDDPYSFHLAVAHFHRIQTRILPGLAAVLPGVRDDEWERHEAAFVRRAAELWQLLERRYSDEIRQQGGADDTGSPE